MKRKAGRTNGLQLRLSDGFLTKTVKVEQEHGIECAPLVLPYVRE
jgi:hypothetical protein